MSSSKPEIVSAVRQFLIDNGFSCDADPDEDLPFSIEIDFETGDMIHYAWVSVQPHDHSICVVCGSLIGDGWKEWYIDLSEPDSFEAIVDALRTLALSYVDGSPQ